MDFNFWTFLIIGGLLLIVRQLSQLTKQNSKIEAKLAQLSKALEQGNSVNVEEEENISEAQAKPKEDKSADLVFDKEAFDPFTMKEKQSSKTQDAPFETDEKPKENIFKSKSDAANDDHVEIAEPKVEQVSNRKAWAQKANQSKEQKSANRFSETKKQEAKPDQKPMGATIKDWASNLELDIGAKLPVWIGALALIISGFFFIKYSIEQELLPPYVRLILLFILGAAMIIGAEQIHKRPKFANGRRISQALVGVGFAVIYGVLYASSQVWEYIANPIAFVGMMATTLGALFFSIRYGIGIAYLSFLAAYALPTLIPSQSPSAVTLFSYLLLIFFAINYVAKMQNWWKLTTATLTANFLWLLYWVYNWIETSDVMILSTFLILQSAVIIWASMNSLKSTENKVEEKTTSPQSLLDLVSASSSALLNQYAHLIGMVFFALIGLFAEMSQSVWLFFSVITVLGLALNFKTKMFNEVPLGLMALGAVLISLENEFYEGFVIAEIFVSALVFIGYFIYQTAQNKQSRLWAIAASITAFAYLLSFYLKAGDHGFNQVAMNDLFFSISAVILALIFIAAYLKIVPKVNEQIRNNVAANFAATATGLISFAIAITFDQTIWAVAFALQMAALSVIDAVLKNKVIRILTLILAAIVMALMLPNLWDLANYMLALTVKPFMTLSSYGWNAYFLNNPVVQLGIPTASFGVAAFYMRKHLDDISVKTFETIALTLFTLLGYLLIRWGFNGQDHFEQLEQSLLETSTTTAFIMVIGLISFYLANYTARQGYILRGWFNIGMAATRIILFDLLLYNALLGEAEMQGIVIFNPLLLTHFLPLLVLFVMVTWLKVNIVPKWSKIAFISTSILAFIGVNMNIRYAFMSDIDIANPTSVAELYTYSLVWLTLGAAILVAAIQTQKKSLRLVSQIVIMLTVCKVFLIDASHLEGLFRIASFAILGIALIVISWVYSKYVLIDDNLEETAEN